MKLLLILSALIFILIIKRPTPEQRLHKLMAEMQADSIKIKKRTADIKGLDIMQGSTEDFIARIDKLAEQSERKRKE